MAISKVPVRSWPVRAGKLAGAALGVTLTASLASCTLVLGTDDFTKAEVDTEGPTSCYTEALQTAPHRADVLFMIQNSKHMGAKQELLRSALPPLVGTMVNPPCIDTAGGVYGPNSPLEECPAGSHRVFPPMMDLHVGILSSSLGGHGSDACPAALGGDDRGHLLHRSSPEAGAKALPTYKDLGFLAWDPLQKLAPPGEADIGGDTTTDPNSTGLTPLLSDMVAGVGQTGCGYESQLESWYRFLVDPTPYDTLQIDGESNVVPTGIDEELLAQRKAFLRPDSLLGIIMLADQDDCSVRDEGILRFVLQHLVPGGGGLFHMPRPRSECAQNPADPCCESCGLPTPPNCNEDPKCKDAQGNIALLTEEEDNINVRCFDQKRRFGLDALQPIQRYVDGLTRVKIKDRDGTFVDNPIFSDLDTEDEITQVRDPSRVVLAAIAGVPWQDIARRDAKGNPDTAQGLDAQENKVGGFMTADQLTEKVPNQEYNTWDLIVGDPDKFVPPKDPFMVPSIDERTGKNPLTDTQVLPSGSATSNDINGHEQAYPIRDDLQVACLATLQTPKNCAGLTLKDCPCADPDNDNPECDVNDQDSGNRTLQTRAAAYPAIRELAVVKGLGAQGIVTSICPDPQDIDPEHPDMKPVYVSTVLALGDRITAKLSVHCVKSQLAAKGSTDPLPCSLIEGRKLTVGQSCDCPSPGRAKVTYGADLTLAKQALDPNFDCFCEIPQVSEKGRVLCQNDTRTTPDLNGETLHGFCYVDGGANIGNPVLSQDCLIKGAGDAYEPGRQLRLLGAAEASPEGALFLSCHTGTFACGE